MIQPLEILITTNAGVLQGPLVGMGRIVWQRHARVNREYALQGRFADRIRAGMPMGAVSVPVVKRVTL